MTFEQRPEVRSVQVEGRAWVPEARENLLALEKAMGPARLEDVNEDEEWQKMWTETSQEDESCLVCRLCKDVAFIPNEMGTMERF